MSVLLHIRRVAEALSTHIVVPRAYCKIIRSRRERDGGDGVGRGVGDLDIFLRRSGGVVHEIVRRRGREERHIVLCGSERRVQRLGLEDEVEMRREDGVEQRERSGTALAAAHMPHRSLSHSARDILPL